MAIMHLWHIAVLASCVMIVVTSPQGEAPAGEEETIDEKRSEAPAGEEERKDEKRSGQYCNVNGRYYQHNEVFTLPGYSHCLKYRCNNGGWRVVQPACERNSRCIPVGSTIRDRCRSLQCMRENRGNMHYYYMKPTPQDMCDAEGKCVAKNRDFTHKNCQTYRCIDTPHGGYDFRITGSPKCKDDNGNCINVGASFSKWSNGRLYRNCICLNGGGYNCRS